MKLPIAEYTIQLTYKCPHCNQTGTIEIDEWDFDNWSHNDMRKWESQLNLEVKDCIHCGNSFEDIRLI